MSFKDLKDKLIAFVEINHPSQEFDDLVELYQDEKEMYFLWKGDGSGPSEEDLEQISIRDVANKTAKFKKHKSLKMHQIIMPISDEESILEFKKPVKGMCVYVTNVGLMIYDGKEWKKIV